jgi:hypothetical protein
LSNTRAVSAARKLSTLTGIINDLHRQTYDLTLLEPLQGFGPQASPDPPISARMCGVGAATDFR